MRTFDQFEESLIRNLKIYYDGGILQNFFSLIDNYLVDKSIIFNKPENKVFIGFDIEKFFPESYDQDNNLIDEANKISLVLVKTIFLLNYLESNGYILMFSEGKPEDKIPPFSRITSLKKPITQEIYDPKICELILEYYSKSIVISQAIIELVDDNFISKEEIRHNENIRVANENLQEAKIAVQQSERAISIATTDLGESKKSVTLSRNSIWVAIGLGILSLGLSTYSIWESNQTKTQKVEIDSTQYKSAEKMMNSVIDNQKATKNKLDTISTIISKIKK